MTGQDVTNRAYDMVGDVGVTKRNAIADVVGYLNDGVRDLLSRRPHIRLNADGTQDSAYTDLTIGNYNSTDLPFDDEYLREALAHYVAYRIFEIDAEDEANDNSANRHLAQYMRLT
jgi:hypothetical protein